MPMECPDCGSRLTAADREGDDYRCDRCGVLVREPRRTRAEDDDDDRPRRRRRRPPKSSGRGLLLVLGGIGLLLLLACGGIIGAVVLAGRPNWQEFRSPTGNFTVDLPAKARPDMAQIAGKQGAFKPGVTCEGTLLLARLEEYCVVYGDLPPGPRGPADDDRILNAALEGIKNAQPPGRVISEKPITVSGFRGREVELRIGEQRRLARIVLTPRRIYTVIAGGPFTDPDDANVRRFIDSFKITEPRRPELEPDPDKWQQ